MGKQKGILVVSYGSSYKEEREKSIGGIERAIAAAFPEYKIYRAFTSLTIVERIWKKDGCRIDSICEALERAVSEGMRQMVIIQTHLVKGIRYEAMEKAVDAYKHKFEQLVVAEPILSADVNIEALADGLVSIGTAYDDGQTAVCFVGHGIDEEYKIAYSCLQKCLDGRGYEHFYIGTLSVKPTRMDLVDCIQKKSIEHRVVLVPLMLVSGYHVRKDLAGTGENSWENTFSKLGYSVECVRRGLGEEDFIQKIFIEHLKNVIL